MPRGTPTIRSGGSFPVERSPRLSGIAPFQFSGMYFWYPKVRYCTSKASRGRRRRSSCLTTPRKRNGGKVGGRRGTSRALAPVQQPELVLGGRRFAFVVQSQGMNESTAYNVASCSQRRDRPPGGPFRPSHYGATDLSVSLTGTLQHSSIAKLTNGQNICSNPASSKTTKTLARTQHLLPSLYIYI